MSVQDLLNYQTLQGGKDTSGFSPSSTGDIVQMLKYLIANAGSRRVHRGFHELMYPATDWWNVGFPGMGSAASATNPAGLSGWGWTSNVSTTFYSFSGDFLSSADVGVGLGFSLNSAGLQLYSPQVFGGTGHLDMVSSILGSTPTKFNIEGWFQYSTHAAGDESSTGFGLFGNTSGSTPTDADAVAMISADATTFRLGKGAATYDNGPARDTSVHKFKISISTATGLTEWFIDGVSQGTIANATDQFPVNFAAITVSAGSSRFYIWPHRFWYE